MIVVILNFLFTKLVKLSAKMCVSGVNLYNAVMFIKLLHIHFLCITNEGH